MRAIKHQNPDLYGYLRATVVLDTPDKETLLDMIETGTRKLHISMGLARVHPDDEFVKKEGVRVATEKMRSCVALLKDVTVREPNRVVYEFHMLDQEGGARYARKVVAGISFVPESPVTRLEYLYVE